MTIEVLDAQLGVDPSILIKVLDALAPEERLALSKALAGNFLVDVVSIEDDGEARLVIVPVEKAITRTVAGMARMGSNRSAAGRTAANARWAGHTPARMRSNENIPAGAKRVEISPGNYVDDYTDYYAQTVDPASTAERAAAVADPDFHGGMTPLDPNAKDSEGQFTVKGPDGKVLKNSFGEPVYSPERTALHDQIIADAMAGVQPNPSGQPKAYFMGGGPASGKSSISKETLGHPDEGKAVVVDADALKGGLPEYRALARAGDPSLAGFAHEESSHLAKRLIRESSAAGVDIVYDGTGDSGIKKLSSKVEDLQNQGYKVDATYLTLPTDLAVKIAKIRGADVGSIDVPGSKTGRVVPESIVRSIHSDVTSTFLGAIEEDTFDSVRLFDTSEKGVARQVLSKSKGSAEVVTDPAAYERFQDKQYATTYTGRSGTKIRVALSGVNR